MKNNNRIYFYGAVLILEGVFLLLGNHLSFHSTKYILGFTLIIAALFALGTAFKTQRTQIQFSYHQMHALAMSIYGISILIFATNIEILTYLTAFLLFFYAFSEIIFCSWLFNLNRKVKHRIIIIRAFLGLVVGIGTVLLMNFFALEKAIVLQGYGILFVIIGCNMVLYVPIMKRKVTIER